MAGLAMSSYTPTAASQAVFDSVRIRRRVSDPNVVLPLLLIPCLSVSSVFYFGGFGIKIFEIVSVSPFTVAVAVTPSCPAWAFRPAKSWLAIW